MTENRSEKKPIKVTNVTLSEKYGIMASNIEELKKKGKEKLSLTADDITVQLEDGTIVEDDDYFCCLPSHTVLVLATPHLLYAPVTSSDVVDSLIVSTLPTSHRDDGSATPVATLAHKLRRDVSQIVNFSTEDLQMLANATPDELASVLNDTDEAIRQLQYACHEHLVEREKTADALYLLEMYKKDDSKISS